MVVAAVATSRYVDDQQGDQHQDCKPQGLHGLRGQSAIGQPRLGRTICNVLSIKSLVCVSVVLVLLTSLNCYMSVLRLGRYVLLLTPGIAF